MTRIAIGGAHGCGKTTFVHRLRDALRPMHTVRVVPDVARLATEPVGTSSTVTAQRWILDTQLRLERALEHAVEICLYDGCSASHFAYLNYWSGSTESIAPNVVASMRNFSSILWLPRQPNFLIADGLRPTDPAFQREIADRQERAVADAGIPIERVPDDWPRWSDEAWRTFALGHVEAPRSAVRSTQYVVAIARVERGEELLFTRRCTPHLPDANRLWEFPGGRPMFGEPPARSVEREVLEETGYLVRADRLMPVVESNVWRTVSGSSEHAIVLCFHCTLLLPSPIWLEPDAEVQAVLWSRPKALPPAALLRGISSFLAEHER